MDAIVAKAASSTKPNANGQPRTKAIIYCQRVAHAEQVAAALGCAVYHSQVGSFAAKSALVRNWAAEGGPIVATNALGAGLDLPDVRWIFHMGLPSSLRNFAQESGRAGRNGDPADSLVVFIATKAVSQASDAPWAGPETEDMEEFVRNRIGCRRVLLDRVLDGYTGRTGCLPKEASCDLCCARAVAEAEADALYEEACSHAPPAPAVGSMLQRQRNQDEGREAGQFASYLKQWNTICMLCYIVQQDGRKLRILEQHAQAMPAQRSAASWTGGDRNGAAVPGASVCCTLLRVLPVPRPTGALYKMARATRGPGRV